MTCTAPFTISAISYESGIYQLELDLRNRVLRRPLGMEIQQDDLSREPFWFHFGAFCTADESLPLVGTVILEPPDSPQHSAVMRQLAVDPDYRHQGVGALLIQAVERFAQMRGIGEITLHARASALLFYEKQGYEKRSEEFLQIGIPHLLMGKQLGEN